MRLVDRRELNRGFGRALGIAFELVLTPLVLGFLGLRLDRFVGTEPLFMLALGIFAFGYLTWKYWRLYEADMEAKQAAIPGMSGHADG